MFTALKFVCERTQKFGQVNGSMISQQGGQVQKLKHESRRKDGTFVLLYSFQLRTHTYTRTHPHKHNEYVCTLHNTECMWYIIHVNAQALFDNWKRNYTEKSLKWDNLKVNFAWIRPRLHQLKSQLNIKAILNHKMTDLRFLLLLCLLQGWRRRKIRGPRRVRCNTTCPSLNLAWRLNSKWDLILYMQNDWHIWILDAQLVMYASTCKCQNIP